MINIDISILHFTGLNKKSSGLIRPYMLVLRVHSITRMDPVSLNGVALFADGTTNKSKISHVVTAVLQETQFFTL